MATEGQGLEITELRLGLPGDGPSPSPADRNEKKRVLSEMTDNDGEESKSATDEPRCQKRSRNRVVGWPPVCSYRRRSSFNERERSETAKMYVKVSMDGAPYLRKLDLGVAKGYADLGLAMENLFGFPIRRSEYIPTYEDGDGDWMLLGDVPWKMFIESCRRLRIMKRSEMNSFSQSSASSREDLSK